MNSMIENQEGLKKLHLSLLKCSLGDEHLYDVLDAVSKLSNLKTALIAMNYNRITSMDA